MRYSALSRYPWFSGLMSTEFNVGPHQTAPLSIHQPESS